jgi:hypothetical protein
MALTIKPHAASDNNLLPLVQDWQRGLPEAIRKVDGGIKV